MAIVSKRADQKRATGMLKRYFRKKKYPFEFSLESPWNDPKVIEGTNCYRYAFDMPWISNDRIVMAFLGWSIGKYEHSRGDVGFSRFQIDLARMGFKFKETKDAITVPKEGYKIALFIFEKDFHFARQNADGNWSEKNGFGAPVELMQDDNGNIITPDQFKCEKEFTLKMYHIYQ